MKFTTDRRILLISWGEATNSLVDSNVSKDPAASTLRKQYVPLKSWCLITRVQCWPQLQGQRVYSMEMLHLGSTDTCFIQAFLQKFFMYLSSLPNTLQVLLIPSAFIWSSWYLPISSNHETHSAIFPCLVLLSLLRSKEFLQHPVLKHSPCEQFSYGERPSFTSTQDNGQNYAFISQSFCF